MKSKTTEVINPLYGVVIGSTVFSKSSQFRSSVIHCPISVMKGEKDTQKFMSGESSYVYSDEMNQGTLGLSGSYGVSGVSKLKSSVSGYIANSSAMSKKSVTVNYNAISVAGIEYVDLEMLRAENLIASLNLASKQAATDTLDAYNAVMAETKQLQVNLLDALESDSPEYDPLKKLVKKWVDLSNKFVAEFGDGIVVGIIWGGFGGVSMDITSQGDASSWEYGGEANFSYAGTGESVSVRATYDGGKNTKETSVEVKCTTFHSGSILDAQINEWRSKVEGKAFSELADVKVMDVAPSMTISKGAPAIPDFVIPEPSKEITEKIDEITDLEGLASLAIASAYEEQRRACPSLTLNEFLLLTDQPANVSPLIELIEDVSDNNINPLEVDERLEPPQETPNPFRSIKADASEISDYAPLGVWVTDWSDLFPWLARGFNNNIDDTSGGANLKERVMLQDFQSLSRIYYTADASGISEIKRVDKSLPSESTAAIADTFSNGAARLQHNVSGSAGMMEIFNSLGSVAKNIYETWNKAPFLRGCELGLGLIKDGKTIGSVIKEDDVGTVYSLERCSFEKDEENYTAFSRCYKVLPLISPDAEILAFGPKQGGLSSAYSNELTFSKPSRAKYISFEFDTDDKFLKNSEHGISLYPIPFSAAESVPWKGFSAVRGISSFGSLNEGLAELKDELSTSSAWTFSSTGWDKNWNGCKAYRQKNVRKQYIGLIEEIRNIL